MEGDEGDEEEKAGEQGAGGIGEESSSMPHALYLFFKQ
jgi:hypothetical protein